MADPQPKAVATANIPKEKTAPGEARSAEEMVAAGFQRYGVEKGALIFRIDGAVQGTEHIFFDNYGWREAKYTRTTTNIGIYHEEQNDVQYLDGERRYVYDPKTNKANYFDSPQVEQMAAKFQTKDMVVVGLEMLKKMGGKPEGKGMVAEVQCDVWKIEKGNITLYMWEGLTLREESYVNELPVGRRCMAIELDKDLPLERLLLPKGAELVGK